MGSSLVTLFNIYLLNIVIFIYSFNSASLQSKHDLLLSKVYKAEEDERSRRIMGMYIFLYQKGDKRKRQKIKMRSIQTCGEELDRILKSKKS